MPKKLNVDNLKYDGVESLGYVNIVEVAIRHGFDPALKDAFTEFVEDRINRQIEYAEWEHYMGDDL